MEFKEDKIWQDLLEQSAPTFKGGSTPPYGFMTSTLALLRAEKTEREQLEKMGKWAVFASLGALGFVLLITLDLHSRDRGELDPGVPGIAMVENVQIY